MKTHSFAGRYCVLSDEEKGLIGILQIPAGQGDISDQIEKAIRLEYDAESVKISDTNSTFTEDFFELGFMAQVNVFGDENDFGITVFPTMKRFKIIGVPMFHADPQRLSTIEEEFHNYKMHSVSWSAQDVKHRAIENFRYMLENADDPHDSVSALMAKEISGCKTWSDYYDETKFEDVILEVIQRHDASIGITWETIDAYLPQAKKSRQEA